MIGLLPDRDDSRTGPCPCGCGVFFINGIDTRRAETMHHTREGLYFGRNNDGAVTVRCEDSTVVLSSGEWASVVAYVSKRGENGTIHAEALAAHTQGEQAA